MPRPHSKESKQAKTLADVPCPFCCCACDDLQVHVEGERITSAEGACEIARPWFLGDRAAERPNCRVDGKPAEIDEALRHAAELLAAARYPLVYGLSRASCEAQRVAVDIAETLRGVIDVPASRGAMGALQSVGEVTATFGEIRNRADLIVAWGADPTTSHPRFFERYAPEEIAHRVAGAGPKGGPGRRTSGASAAPPAPATQSINDRSHLIVVDSQRTRTADLADERIAIRAGGEFDAVTVLRGIAKGLRLSPEQVVERTGVALTVWQALSDRMTQARFVVLLTGDGDDSPMARRTSEGLAHLVRELNRRTRFVSISLRSAPNGLGAENVLAWRTGYSTAVDFSKGFPQFDPDGYAAERLLTEGAVDAMLVVCADPMVRWSAAAKQRFAAIPSIALDWQQTATMAGARVSIPLATLGVESGGTILRGDGVPLALRPAIESRTLADHESLAVISTSLNALRAPHA
jgi:formylmethanofuran dehydrogenase subunit B